MPWVGLEPTIQAFERAKTVHALDCAATVIGSLLISHNNSEITHLACIWGVPGMNLDRIFCTDWRAQWVSSVTHREWWVAPSHNFSKTKNYCSSWSGLVVRIPGYRSRGPGFDTQRYQIFWEVVGLERGPLSLVRIIEELLEWKSSGFGKENRINGRRDPLRWPRDTLYPQKLALTSPTSGGRSIGWYSSLAD
jgi:hypothetical protein